MTEHPTTPYQQLSAEQQQAFEAAAFRRLVQHLQQRTDVQNIDLMNTAGFCRNCLSKWLRESAAQHSVELDDADARQQVYGMPYSEWKANFQT